MSFNPPEEWVREQVAKGATLGSPTQLPSVPQGGEGERKRRNKYNARKTTVDGVTFDSAKEAARYTVLKLMEKTGVITGLELQPEYPLAVEGRQVAVYKADFKYRVVKTGAVVVEDVKSVATKTPVYRLKVKLVAALYGIQVVEV